MDILRYTNNSRPFSEVCNKNFGRKVITTNKMAINSANIVEEIGKSYAIHQQNREEIAYLDRYYRGDQPILYRNKVIRPEVNNKVVENIAQYIVETKASEMVGEPIQYVLRGADETKTDELTQLNSILESVDKNCDDTEICRWRSICGTAYRFIGNTNNTRSELDADEIYMSVENPELTYVVYFNNGYPAYSVQIRENEESKEVLFVYTNTEWFAIVDGEIVEQGLNGNKAIPVIEYPNNARRLSDIEITISLTDEINKMASDRSNGIEQFVSSWIKFINCEIDVDTYKQMRQEGALVVKSNNGSENKADVDVMTSELNQTESQVAVSDLFEKLLIIQGMANREGNTGGDTAGAVSLRNGHYDAEKRAEMYEPIFKKAERNALKIILNRLRIKKGFSLVPSDIEIKISRTKMDNMLTKAQTLNLLLTSGVAPKRAIKSVGLFADPEQVAIESEARMNVLYPTEIVEEVE